MIIDLIGIEERVGNAIVDIVSDIGFKKQTDKGTKLETKIVIDANNLDAIGAIGVARCFAFGGAKMRPYFTAGEDVDCYKTREEYISGKKASFTHLKEKIIKLKNSMFTHTALAMAEERHLFVERFIEEFEKEVKAAGMDDG